MPEKVYKNLYRKKHAVEKFREQKMGLGSSNAFYSKFIKTCSRAQVYKKNLTTRIYVQAVFPYTRLDKL